MIFQGGGGGSRPPFCAKLQFRSVLSGAHPLSSTHRAWGIIQDQDGDCGLHFYTEEAGAHIQRGKCPSPHISLDAIFLFRGQTNLAMRHMFAYSMKKSILVRD